MWKKEFYSLNFKKIYDLLSQTRRARNEESKRFPLLLKKVCDNTPEDKTLIIDIE